MPPCTEREEGIGDTLPDDRFPQDCRLFPENRLPSGLSFAKKAFFLGAVAESENLVLVHLGLDYNRISRANLGVTS